VIPGYRLVRALPGALPGPNPRPTGALIPPRYMPGEIGRRLDACGRLIDRRRAILFGLSLDATGVEAREIGRQIALLGRLHRSYNRLRTRQLDLFEGRTRW